MVKHPQTIRRLFPNNCVSVFDHFVGLAIEGLRRYINFNWRSKIKWSEIEWDACKTVRWDIAHAKSAMGV